MAEHEAAGARWARHITNGLRVMGWAALIGAVGSSGIAFLIPIVGGTRHSLWITRYWSIAFEVLALAGLLLATRRPSVTGAGFTFGTSALVVRVLGLAAVLIHVVVVFLPGVSGSQKLPLAIVLSWHVIRAAAKVLLVGYVGSLLRRFGVVQLGRAMQWTAIALAALWVINYPAEVVVMALVNVESAIGWTYAIAAMALGGVLLLWTCACLLKAAKLIATEVRGRCINCGYILVETSCCSECGARYERAEERGQEPLS